MVPQQKLISLIKDAITRDMDGRTLEQMHTYKPDECTIFESVHDRLEEEDIREQYLESDGFYWRFRANFDELKESDWYYDLKHENTRDAYEARQKEKNPYGYYGVNKSDFFA